MVGSIIRKVDLGVVCCCALALAPSLTAQVATPTGAWRQMNVTWKKPPAELDLKERYAESAVLYFSPAHRFVLLYGTVIRGPASEAISGVMVVLFTSEHGS